MSVFWQHLIFAIIESGWIKCDGGESEAERYAKDNHKFRDTVITEFRDVEENYV